MTNLRKAAGVAYEVPLHELLEGVPENARLIIDSEDGMSTRFIPVGHLCKRAAQALRQALAQPVDAVPGFTVTEPRQSLSRMKPGDRFVLVRTSEIYHIKKDGSQWNETRQRPARLHKNSQVRLIVDAINMSQERVDETAKREHEPVGYIDGMYGGYMVFTPLNPSAVYLNGTALYTAPQKREWVGLTVEEARKFYEKYTNREELIYAIDKFLEEKNGG